LIELTVDGKNFREDELLNKEVIKLIVNKHTNYYSLSKINAVLRHKKIKDMEIDGIIILKHRTVIRLFGIELKEYNIVDVIRQAIVRRRFFHYFYIITRFPRHTIGELMKEVVSGKNNYYLKHFKVLFKYKIGWIAYEKKYPPMFLLPSFFKKPVYKINFIRNLNNKIIR